MFQILAIQIWLCIFFLLTFYFISSPPRSISRRYIPSQFLSHPNLLALSSSHPLILSPSHPLALSFSHPFSHPLPLSRRPRSVKLGRKRPIVVSGTSMFGLNEQMVQDAIASLPGFERVRVCVDAPSLLALMVLR